jgi:tellurite resistance protein TerC
VLSLLSVSSTPVTTPFSHWLFFHLALLLLLAAELIYSRWGLAKLSPVARPRRQKRNAIAATVMWSAAALALGIYFLVTLGHPAATQFLAGYAIEESLSIDNLFVFLLLFRIFAIPETFQPRVLDWGVLGAILLRGAFISAGIGLLERFHWVSYLFALILLAASIRLLIPQHSEDPDQPAKAPTWVRWISRIHPVSLRHDIFFTREPVAPGLPPRRMVTMLFLALIAIETADIIFALDSIPAVLSITRVPFIAYTSNILAVMGLRSLYFLLAHMFKKLRYLHFGLAFVLLFAAAKMLLADWLDIGPLTSLAVIIAILAITITASLTRNPKPQP